MKKVLLLSMAVLALLVTSCSGAGSDNDKGSLFGSLPKEYAKMMAERENLKEQAKNVKSEAEKAKLIEKGKKMDEEWSAKLESTAKGLDGKEIVLADGEFKVTAPLSLTFEKLNGNDLEPSFMINGSAENIDPITIENRYLPSCIVYIAGYDAEGNELFKSEVGSIKGTLTNNVLEIPAGVQVEFTTLRFNGKYVDEYSAAKTLKLIM